MMGAIIMFVLVGTFIVIGLSMFALLEAPFVAGLPFGWGEWIMGNAPAIFAVSLWMFLMSLTIMRGSMDWKLVAIFTVISVIVFIVTGGLA